MGLDCLAVQDKYLLQKSITISGLYITRRIPEQVERGVMVGVLVVGWAGLVEGLSLRKLWLVG